MKTDNMMTDVQKTDKSFLTANNLIYRLEESKKKISE